MSSSDNNITCKNIFFIWLNSEFIKTLFRLFSDPSSLPEGWKKFFEGLSENEKLILNDINGPSWSPVKKIKNKS